jgi:hypothetical protein
MKKITSVCRSVLFLFAFVFGFGLYAEPIAKGVWVTATSPWSPGWWNIATKMVGDTLAGTIATNVAVSDPGQYGRVNGYQVAWHKMLTSTGTSMWNGQLNPSAPFQSELGCVAQLILDVSSSDGTDEVSLADLELHAHSSDAGDLLGKNNPMSISGEYGPAAVLIKSDGRVVKSGSGSDRGKRLVVVVYRLFSAGANPTESSLKSNQTWFDTMPDFRAGFEVRFKSTGKVLLVTSVTTGVGPAAPILSATPAGVVWTNHSPWWSVRLLRTEALVPTSWAPTTFVLTGTNAVPVSAGFFRGELQ